MSKGKDKERVYDVRTNAAIEETKKLSPLEQWQTDQQNKTLRWLDGAGEYAGKAKNILDMPGMENTVDVYGSSRAATETDRYGGGALNLANPSSGAYANQQKQLNNFNFANNRAEGISNAAANLKAQNLGQMNMLIDRDTARKNTAANLEMENRRDYYNRPKQSPWWATALGLATGGAQAASGLGFTPFKK